MRYLFLIAVASALLGSAQLAAQPPSVFTLTNARGMEARITNFGGILMSLKVPDRQGRMEDVVLGFDTPEEYRDKEHPYFGALIGRYANRIANAQFTLNGQTYKLAANNNGNSLHGGNAGFDKKVWQASQKGNRLTLTLVSPDGEEGYPGALTVTAVYELTEDNELRLTLTAKTTKPTVVNLTNHTYFNLGGPSRRDILGHDLRIFASRFTPVNEKLIPTGELRSVTGTPFDFRDPIRIGERIDDASDEQIRFGLGYDHNYVLDRVTKDGLDPAAQAHDPISGRTLLVLTSQPAVQLYTGNFLDGTIKGKGGVVYGKRKAFCLETQHYPDSPNQAAFPTTVLKPGQTYRHTTVYRFSTK
jgi:aldose 1-epimerase